MPKHRLDEIVDDSEPEREEIRQKERAKKKTTPEAFKPASPPLMSPRPTPLTPKVMKMLSEDVLEISDSVSEPGIEVLVFQGSQAESVVTEMADLPEYQAETAPPPKEPSFVRPTPDWAVDDVDSDKDELSFNLGRFAFTGQQSSLSRANSLRLKDKLVNVQSAKPDTSSKSKTKTKAHAYSNDFSESELARLLKCVGCDTIWTVRKTVKEKMKHVQTCTKKNSLSEETVRVLLRKEIDKTPAPTKAKVKGKVRDTVTENQAPPPAKTFMEGVVNGAGPPKKKSRQAEVTQTVKSVTETRSAILQRAGALLERRSESLPTAANDESSVQTQAFRPSKLLQTRSLPDRTESGNPGFALGFRRTPTPPPREDESVAMAATQVFAPSRLAQLQRQCVPTPESVTKRSIFELASSNRLSQRPTIPVNGSTPLRDKENNNCRIHTNKTGESSSLNGQTSKHSGNEQNERESDIIPPDESFGYPQYYDSAFIHFEPDPARVRPEESPINKLLSTTGLSERTIPIPTHSNAPSETPPQAGTQSSSRAPRSESPVKRSKKKKETSAERDAWDAQMRAKIVRDEQLHLRILRFEPIHFDVFLKLVGEPAPAPATKLKLKTLLDKLLVNFYGADGPLGRRRGLN